MSQVKVFNKARGVTYVYESESYWDKEKKQPRSKRKLIGKIDPKTGEIVETGTPVKKQKRKKIEQNVQSNYQKLYEKSITEIDNQETKIFALKKRVKELELEVFKYQRKLDQVRDLVNAH